METYHPQNILHYGRLFPRHKDHRVMVHQQFLKQVKSKRSSTNPDENVWFTA